MQITVSQSVGEHDFFVLGVHDPKIPRVEIEILGRLTDQGLIPRQEMTVVGISNLLAIKAEVDRVLHMTMPVCKNCRHHRVATMCLYRDDEQRDCPTSSEPGAVIRFSPKPYNKQREG